MFSWNILHCIQHTQSFKSILKTQFSWKIPNGPISHSRSHMEVSVPSLYIFIESTDTDGYKSFVIVNDSAQGNGTHLNVKMHLWSKLLSLEIVCTQAVLFTITFNYTCTHDRITWKSGHFIKQVIDYSPVSLISWKKKRAIRYFLLLVYSCLPCT